MAIVRTRIISEIEYKNDHDKFKIIYGFHDSPFGHCLLGLTSTDKAIAFFAFVDGDHEEVLTELKRHWPLSELVTDYDETYQVVQSIFFPLAGVADSWTLLLKGSEFQIKVWESVLCIPMGTSVTYKQIADDINNPKAARAIGNALNKNKIGYLIPCHRVRGQGGSNKYKWGTKTKEAIMLYEQKLKPSE